MDSSSPDPRYATQYDSHGDRYTTSSFRPSDLVLAPIDAGHSVPCVSPSLDRELSSPTSPGPALKVECLQYRDSLSYKWYNTPKDGHLRISLGGAGSFFVLLSRYEQGEWRPISEVFKPDLASGPHDVFVPPAQYGPPMDFPPPSSSFEEDDLTATEISELLAYE